MNDAATTERCDPEVYNQGVAILIIGEGGSERIEAWVQKFAAAVGQTMDWHYMAGRAVVRTLASHADARKVQEHLASDEGAALREALDALSLGTHTGASYWTFYVTQAGQIGQVLPDLRGELNLRREAQFDAAFVGDPRFLARMSAADREAALVRLAKYAQAALVEVGRLENLVDDEIARVRAETAARGS